MNNQDLPKRIADAQSARDHLQIQPDAGRQPANDGGLAARIASVPALPHFSGHNTRHCIYDETGLVTDR